MFRYFLHSFAIATLLLSVADALRLAFERGDHGTGNIITLMCSNDQGTRMNIDSVKFFVNRTSTPDEMSLDQMIVVHPSEDETSISFEITGELEGYYVCGTLTPQTTSDNSVPLIVLPTNDGFLEGREIYASGGSKARIPCSFQPGMLQACYFGEWYKNTTRIFSISQPSNEDMICGSVSPGRQITNMNASKYRVDEETFELIISSVNARDDSGPYQCQLFVLNPASGQTSRFRSMPVNLTIDGQPNILEGGAPRDVIVGLETDGEELLRTATFECVALGRPVPIINWYYIIVNQDGTMGTKKRLSNDDRFNITSNSGSEDRTRRFQRTSMLTMSVTENDGGIIKCQTGASFKDAYLTVLSKPSISIITSLRGEIVYTIRLPVHLNRPVKLNFAYQDVENRGIVYDRDSQPVEIFNDTSEITYHEIEGQVPDKCKKCHVIVSLTAQMGSQVKQGLSVTSQDVIDVEARTPQEKIDHLTAIAIGIGLTLGIIILVIIIAVVSCCLIYVCLKQRQSKINLEKNKKKVFNDVEDLGKDVILMEKHINNEDLRMEMVARIKTKLQKLEKFITTDFDDVSSNSPRVDLEQVDKDLEGILSKYEIPQGQVQQLSS